MQGLVLVDGEGRALRPAMSYMDQRAVAQWSGASRSGLRIAGLNARKALLSLLVTGGASASVKDPVWKYAWVKENEPELFAGSTRGSTSRSISSCAAPERDNDGRQRTRHFSL